MAKVLVSIDEALLVRIDRAASEAGLSRSAYLSRLAADDLGASTGAGAHPRAKRALKRLDDLFAENPAIIDSTAAVREARDSR